MADFLRRYKAGRPVDEIDVAKVHSQMIDELRTNASGHLGRRYPARASELQVKDPLTLFPAFALDAYLRPSTSPLGDKEQGWPGFGRGEAIFQRRGRARNEGRGDLEGFAKACERFFEWGTKDLVAKKFASESVGLFGAELVTCARERIRLSDPKMTVRPPTQARDLEAGSRMTSFFQSTSQPSSSSRPRKSFTTLPPHVVKIHQIRQDPTNNDLKEYRISFTTSAYIDRCHNVMDGHRVDPKQLDATDRATLGLVDKDTADAETAPTAASKTEARLWIAEYLVQEAWPELVKAYEDEQAAKAKPKSKPNPKAKATATRKGKVSGTGGENAEAFKSFFTQRPVPARASTPEEEEEEIEYREPSMPSRTSSSTSAIRLSSSPSSRSRRDSTLTPPPPLEPLPTMDRIKKNVRRAPPSSVSASVTSSSSRAPAVQGSQGSSTTQSNNTGTGSARTTTTPPRRSTRRSTRSVKHAKPDTGVIDLCSTDDEAHTPVVSPRGQSKSATPRRVLMSTSKTNTPPPAVVRSQSKASIKSTPKGKNKEKAMETSTQTLLGLPIVRPTTSQTKPTAHEPRAAKESAVKRREQAKAPLFLVTYEDEKVVEIDVRGRWARGESVGPWEGVEG